MLQWVVEQQIKYLGRQSDLFISEVQAEDRSQDTQFHADLQMQALDFHQLNSRKKSWRFYILFSLKIYLKYGRDMEFNHMNP